MAVRGSGAKAKIKASAVLIGGTRYRLVEGQAFQVAEKGGDREFQFVRVEIVLRYGVNQFLFRTFQ